MVLRGKVEHRLQKIDVCERDPSMEEATALTQFLPFSFTRRWVEGAAVWSAWVGSAAATPGSRNLFCAPRSDNGFCERCSVSVV
jgi:hypothetical protein